MGSPGVAPGLHRLRVGCTVCQYAEPVKRKSLRVVPPHRFLLMREASCCWTTEREIIAAAGIEPTAFWLWARWLATCLRCDKADPPAGLAPTFCPLPTDRSAISAWMEWKLDVPTGNAPVASVLQTEWLRETSLCSSGTKGVRCVGLAPTRQASQA